MALQPTVDVLVIGAGGCGLTAALASDHSGAEVAIVEKAGACQGNTALSSGSIPAAGSRLQAQNGVADDPACFARDLARVAGPHDAEHLTETLARTSAELIDFLTDVAAIELTLVTGYRHVGHSKHRLHAPPSRRGADLMAGLERAVRERAIPLGFSQPARRLLTTDGVVNGAVIDDGSADGFCIGARSTILACNGFGAAPHLLGRHCPGALDAEYAGAPGSEGEALVWGGELGARTGNLGAWQGHAGLSAASGSLMTWTLVERGAIILNGRGHRFGDETLGYSALAELALGDTPPFHLVYDATIAADVAAGQPDFAEACALGVARAATDAADLADQAGLPSEAVAASLEEARMAVTTGLPDRFGRKDWGAEPLGPELRHTRIRPALFHTQGGLQVDERAQVLHATGGPISGLYAGGGAAAGISGRSGSRGYVSGNGLLAALGLGLIAGRSAAAHALALSSRDGSAVDRLQPTATSPST